MTCDGHCGTEPSLYDSAVFDDPLQTVEPICLVGVNHNQQVFVDIGIFDITAKYLVDQSINIV